MVTLPLIYALQEQPQNGHYQQVHDLLSSTTRQEDDIQEIVIWVNGGYGIQRAFADAHAYSHKAKEALYHFSPSPDRAVLDELVDFVIARNR